jgi:ferredoxin
MIVGNQKPFQEIVASISGYRKVLIMGCGTCVSVCLTGGDKEARALTKALYQEFREKENPPIFEMKTIERQCERDWIVNFLEIPGDTEAILSLACGAGVQTLADVFEILPIVPALNTTFLGALDRPGEWNEKCLGCGGCVLNDTGGICPVARCAKKLFNGPCGGTSNGKCEISAVIGREVDCAWSLIIQRLAKLGKLDQYHIVRQPKDWTTENASGPRTLMHTG